MAKIATTHQQADVIAESTALDATVNFSGALMEMLATTYVYILMAAIRVVIPEFGSTALADIVIGWWVFKFVVAADRAHVIYHTFCVRPRRRPS